MPSNSLPTKGFNLIRLPMIQKSKKSLDTEDLKNLFSKRAQILLNVDFLDYLTQSEVYCLKSSGKVVGGYSLNLDCERAKLNIGPEKIDDLSRKHGFKLVDCIEVNALTIEKEFSRLSPILYLSLYFSTRRARKNALLIFLNADNTKLIERYQAYGATFLCNCENKNAGSFKNISIMFFRLPSPLEAVRRVVIKLLEKRFPVGQFEQGMTSLEYNNSLSEQTTRPPSASRNQSNSDVPAFHSNHSASISCLRREAD